MLQRWESTWFRDGTLDVGNYNENIRLARLVLVSFDYVLVVHGCSNLDHAKGYTEDGEINFRFAETSRSSRNFLCGCRDCHSLWLFFVCCFSPWSNSCSADPLIRLVGDAPMGWKTNYIIALLVCGVAFICGFVAWEHTYKYPIMPMYIWRDRTFSAVSRKFPVEGGYVTDML